MWAWVAGGAAAAVVAVVVWFRRRRIAATLAESAATLAKLDVESSMRAELYEARRTKRERVEENKAALRQLRLAQEVTRHEPVDDLVTRIRRRRKR